MEITRSEWLRDAERRRQVQVERIKRWEQTPVDSIYRRNEDQYQRFMDVLRASLRLIDNGIELVKAGKGAVIGGISAEDD